jgi:hypothetical protein
MMKIRIENRGISRQALTLQSLAKTLRQTRPPLPHDFFAALFRLFSRPFSLRLRIHPATILRFTFD